MGENGKWEKKIMGFSRKPLQILHSSFIIHHSSFPLSPLLLNSFVLHFFKRLNSYKIFKKTTEATEITEVTEIAEGEI